MPTALDRSFIIRRDPGAVGVSLDRLADQLRDGWRQARRVRVPASHRRVDRIAVCGMGGSHLGADILRSALATRLKMPMHIVADYGLPAWVDRRTLVFCSSYSGSTEETLGALPVALQRGARVIVVTSGGKLAAAAKHHRLPLYQYTPSENPSGQPRLGVAYGLMAMLACLRSIGAVRVTEAEIRHLPTIAWETTKRCAAKKPLASNVAKQAALAMADRVPLLIGAEWTAGNLHSLHNQINENAKTFCAWYQLPDLNHHLLEGLRNRSVTKRMQALMIVDTAYNQRTQVRFALTLKILKQLGARVSSYRPRGATSLEKAIDLLAFGGYVSWYMAASRNVNPALIPTVDLLKRQLAKQ